jgi:hypothetical protein
MLKALGSTHSTRRENLSVCLSIYHLSLSLQACGYPCIPHCYFSKTATPQKIAGEGKAHLYKTLKKKKSGRWWLMPLGLAIWEAEIRRIKVRSYPKQIVHETSSPK